MIQEIFRNLGQANHTYHVSFAAAFCIVLFDDIDFFLFKVLHIPTC
jgi:hypothetical protein